MPIEAKRDIGDQTLTFGAICGQNEACGDTKGVNGAHRGHGGSNGFHGMGDSVKHH